MEIGVNIPILAEPGSTASESLDQFTRLIAEAAAAGCTAFKPQWTSNPDRLCARRRAWAYRAAYEKIAYPLAWHAELSAAARGLGMQYVVSVYVPEDAGRVAPFVDALKCASFEAQDHEFLAALSATGKPVYVSTGMMDLDEAVQAARGAAAILHCTSAYVAPMDSLNLRAIQALREAVTVPVGYSDHSANVLTGALAVACGAVIVEVHMRPADCPADNADYLVSLPPAKLAEYVRNIRLAESMLGNGIKRAMESERPMMKYRVGV